MSNAIPPVDSTDVAADGVLLPDSRESRLTVRRLVEQILDEAKQQGATAAEVVASEDVGLNVSVRMGQLESVEFNSDRGFDVAVYLGQRRGSASTSDSAPSAIAETVRRALDIARHTQPDEYAGLADADLMPSTVPDLDLYHPWALSAQAAEDMALRCEAAGLEVDPRVDKSDGAQASTGQSCRVYGNSHGFVGDYLGTRHGVSSVFIATDDAGMQRDYWYSMHRQAEMLEDPVAVGREAAQRALRRLGPRKVKTGNYPVFFSPQMAAGLVRHVIGALSGGAIYRKASFLHDQLGKRALAAHLSLTEQPLLPKQLGSAAFDGDGVATWDKHFVNSGVVENFVLSAYSARRLDMTTTGNAGGVHNLKLHGQTLPLAELLATVPSGLYVTELMGQGVNGVTGDYSRGAAGYWVENGEFAYPVDGITIAGNLKDMLQQVEALGDDVDLRGNVHTPSLLIKQMMVAGE